MKIELFTSYCPELRKTVQIALDVEADDPYRDSFKTAFTVPMELRFLLANIEGIASFVDVGANIGHFCIAAGLIGIPTIAIEAMADNYLLLARSLSANTIRNVIPFHLAASDNFSPVTLQDRGAWASVTSSGVGHTPGIPLDQLLRMMPQHVPDLIKIDVEGHEIPVLRGLDQTLRQARPMLIFEGNNWMARASGGYLRLLEEVASRDYDLFMFNRDGTMYEVSTTGIQDVVCVDYFASPKGTVKPRAHPRLRTPSVAERMSRIEADIDGGVPHRWHIATIIDRFEAENGGSGRLDAIKRRLAQASAGDPVVASI